MSKYIEADRLRAEIKRLITDPTLCSTKERKIGGHTALLKLVSFLDSLQQEQPEVEGVVQHVGVASYIATNTEQLNACLRRFPDGTKVKITITKEGDQ